MELSPCLIPTSLNNRVSCVHVNADRQTERPCLTEETDERLDCQATQKLSALFQEEHERVRMYTRVFMQVCTCCEQRGDLARQWGIMGDEFLRTLTPSDPAQPNKSWESDCRLADGVEDKFRDSDMNRNAGLQRGELS